MEIPKRFIDRHVIISGAGGGIGAGIARRFIEEGAKVTVADIDAAKGDQIVAELKAAGAQAQFVQVDVSDEASIKYLESLPPFEEDTRFGDNPQSKRLRQQAKLLLERLKSRQEQ